MTCKCCLCVCIRLTIREIICWSMKSRPSMCQLSLPPTSSSVTSRRHQTSCPSRWQQQHQHAHSLSLPLCVSRYAEIPLEFLTDTFLICCCSLHKEFVTLNLTDNKTQKEKKNWRSNKAVFSSTSVHCEQMNMLLNEFLDIKVWTNLFAQNDSFWIYALQLKAKAFLSIVAITDVFYQSEVKGQSGTSLTFSLSRLCCSLQVGDIVSVIDMPPKEDTTWWRGKHGFQVCSSQYTSPPEGKDTHICTHVFSLCLFLRLQTFD